MLELNKRGRKRGRSAVRAESVRHQVGIYMSRGYITYIHVWCVCCAFVCVCVCVVE